MGTSQFTLRFSEPEVHIGVSNRRFIEPNRRFEPEVQTGYRWIINLKQNVKQQAMIINLKQNDHFRGKRFKEVQRTANRLPSSSGSIQRTANREPVGSEPGFENRKANRFRGSTSNRPIPRQVYLQKFASQGSRGGSKEGERQRDTESGR